MSQEMYQLFQHMDVHRLETQLALQCAPLLSSLKISNLLIVAKEYEQALFTLLEETDILFYRLYLSKEKATFFLYRYEELSNYLQTQEVSELMSRYGYDGMEPETLLQRFQTRYANYRNQKAEFPHEMGLLLGYPVDDVNGFIANEGKNSLYTSYWKVISKYSKQNRRICK